MLVRPLVRPAETLARDRLNTNERQEMVDVNKHFAKHHFYRRKIKLIFLIIKNQIDFFNNQIFKHDYKISSYLDLTRNSTNRKDLVKIAIGQRRTGRYNPANSPQR